MAIKPLLRALLASVLVVFLLAASSCGEGTTDLGPISPAAFPNKTKKPTETKPADIALWYDNTQSMAGFLKTPGGSEFISAIESLIDVIGAWNRPCSYYSIDSGKVVNGITRLEWKELPSGVDFAEAFKHPYPDKPNCFYTYNKDANHE